MPRLVLPRSWILAASIALAPVLGPPAQAEVSSQSRLLTAPVEDWSPDAVFTIDGGADGPIEAGVWLPSPSSDSGGAPLIVFSHGNGGSLRGHGDTARALAEAGFVVAALTHPGDNYRDGSRSSQLTARAAHLSRLIDHMTVSAFGETSTVAIDRDRIGAFGFSAGGFTVTTAIGGVSDLAAIRRHCGAQANDFACRLLAFQPIDASTWRPNARDDRIKAAVIAAPALGYAFTSKSLAEITIPVQLWRAGDDQILPSPYNVEPIRDRLSTSPEYHVAAGAGHYDFLPPCPAELAAAAPAICAETPEFDRAAFHESFNREVVRFFREHLWQRQSQPLDHPHAS